MLAQPLHRMHAAVASLPRPVAVASSPRPCLAPGAGLRPYGQPLLHFSADFPNGIDHPIIDFVAVGIAILGQLLHLRQALEAVPSQAAYQMVWVAQLRRSYAFADRHVAAERVTLLVAALPPRWVLAAQDAAAEVAAGRMPPPEPSVAMAAMIPCLAWQRSAAAVPLALRTYMVREGTALLTAPQRRRRLQSYFTPSAVEAAGAARDGSSQEVQALLRRLWRLHCDNGFKKPFRLLAHTGLPISVWLQTTCKCGAAAAGDRLHHYWACPVAAGQHRGGGGRQQRPAPRHLAVPCPSRHPCRCVGTSVPGRCCSHGPWPAHAVCTGPPPEAPLPAIPARSARARFWSHLTDFIAYDCAPLSWRNHCPTGHPFAHIDPATSRFAVHCPTAAAAAPPDAARGPPFPSFFQSCPPPPISQAGGPSSGVECGRPAVRWALLMLWLVCAVGDVRAGPAFG